MRVLALMAHPDDIEMTCAGTLILLRRAGWDVHLATMTAGDLGTATRSRAEISRIRQREAAASARRLGAAYTCLGFPDLTIVYGEATKRRVSALLRIVRPDLVIVPSPVDYMADHEETPRIVREAAFASTVPNWRASLGGRRPRPCAKLPAILYADPIDNMDHFGRRVPAQYVVDITGSVDDKEKMLACHDSQRSWLRHQHGEDEYLRWMRRVGADRARDFGRPRVEYAEGFRQHLGHGFPREDHLTASLGKRLVRRLPVK
ncbi:MAG TPA: PIG-L deacetylase family protein [Vicinamibacteria bacterium]|nr:PIG-L deacetylase family protein [Vicinamibacteria bacterium]